MSVCHSLLFDSCIVCFADVTECELFYPQPSDCTFSWICRAHSVRNWIFLFPLVHALDTAPRLSSTSLLDRNLVIVISLECARHVYSLTMRLASGCAPNFARSLSLSAPSIILSVFPLSFATVPSLSRSYNTDDQPSLPHWTVCLSFWQQILAH